MELTGGLGADVAIEAVGVPETFELCTELIRPGGRVANVGVHGKCATLHLEKLWIRDVADHHGPRRHEHDAEAAQADRGRPARPDACSRPITSRSPTPRRRYDVFAAAAETHALKVVLQAVPVEHEVRKASGSALTP